MKTYNINTTAYEEENLIITTDLTISQSLKDFKAWKKEMKRIFNN